MDLDIMSPFYVLNISVKIQQLRQKLPTCQNFQRGTHVQCLCIKDELSAVAYIWRLSG